MIFIQDNLIKISGTLLPGVVKSLEITDDARMEEQEVEGNAKKPKQIAGYEDAKISIELILIDIEEGMTKEQQLDIIQNLFKKAGQALPVVHELVNKHTAARGVSKVVFKNMSTKEENKKDQLTATLEFWAYEAMTITATKSTGGSGSSGSGLTATGAVLGVAAATGTSVGADYDAYLSSDSRGTAPDRTSGTPATDGPVSSVVAAALAALPY